MQITTQQRKQTYPKGIPQSMQNEAGRFQKQCTQKNCQIHPSSYVPWQAKASKLIPEGCPKSIPESIPKSIPKSIPLGKRKQIHQHEADGIRQSMPQSMQKQTKISQRHCTPQVYRILRRKQK